MYSEKNRLRDLKATSLNASVYFTLKDYFAVCKVIYLFQNVNILFGLYLNIPLQTFRFAKYYYVTKIIVLTNWNEIETIAYKCTVSL